MTSLTPDAISALSRREVAQLKRRYALHCKYEKAVVLYADTALTLKEIASQCGVTASGLGVYLRRYWRELLLKRHQIPTEGKEPQEVKAFSIGEPLPKVHAKYKEAVEACDNMEYIEFNTSQVARKFNLDGTALGNFMRIHYAEILDRREKVRVRLGLNDNFHRGVRPECVEQYGEAVELYRSTDMTLPEVAEKCQVSESGLSQHLRFYHKELLKQKRQVRELAKAKQSKTRGELTGNGRRYEPASETIEKYKEALALYKETALPMKEIVRRTGVSAEGFRFYLHKWHKESVLERLGITGDVGENADLRKAKRKMKSVADKYAKAIGSLKEQPRPFANVANEFGFNPETFREYLHKHEPDLVRRTNNILKRTH